MHHPQACFAWNLPQIIENFENEIGNCSLILQSHGSAFNHYVPVFGMGLIIYMFTIGLEPIVLPLSYFVQLLCRLIYHLSLRNQNYLVFTVHKS
jgi:hypothetical protein